MENPPRVVYGCRARKLQDGCGSLFSDFLLDHILELVKDACFLQFLLGCLEVYGKVDFRVVIFFRLHCFLHLCNIQTDLH